MTTFSFLDDYSEGAHPDILSALTESNYVQQAPYGDDTYSADATNRIKARLGANFDGAIHYVASGTMANIVSISSCLRPHEAVIAVSSGHIVMREAGAIEATGHKLITVPAVDGKLTPANIEVALSSNAHFPHMAKPRLIYISNATETGTVYSLPELQAISALARQRGLILFLDGARLGAALASSKNDATLADIASLVDIFWIGGTKLGALLGEAIVVCNPALTDDFAFHLKQRGGMLAKGRLLGIQFQALFGAKNLFVENARHANAMAAKLAAGIVERGYTLDSETATNQVFPVLPDSVIAALQERFSFYVWSKAGNGRSVIRLVTSWATDESQIDAFLARLPHA
ncbi:aminotransferase class I/II-fold pyridoxal phosphate-dependent enzyme [Paraburkholderia bryophila]|uniref:threonine aldolase family protein n=1 Tax=Paraburkholderia bryophila TaxID=420952 RepID=UPI00234A7FB4|nr:aminotransferase class I/II-fold pyridoxal phosphate-dependent enzyme [Paraburkholderia bryophila]WCM22497.1 aminotransferase class I/II-fold pyridoxal phosphate-dependent enzyme [Paraburkholderia bryophila]